MRNCIDLINSCIYVETMSQMLKYFDLDGYKAIKLENYGGKFEVNMVPQSVGNLLFV
jgi:hypothetical protein